MQQTTANFVSICYNLSKWDWLYRYMDIHSVPQKQ